MSVADDVVDMDYLAAALRRAGRPAPEGELHIEPLLDGRTGATVQRIRCGDRSFVLKRTDEHSWRVTGMGSSAGGEPALWEHGVTRDLDGPIRCPVIDVTRRSAGDTHWILMDDVSSGIRDRGAFTRQDTRALIGGLAAMQAPRLGDRSLRDAPLPPVSGPTGLLRTGVLHVSGERTSRAAWVRELVEDFQVMTAFLPLFLQTVGPKLADEYLTLVADDGWFDMLDREPATLLHGDLRRANMSLRDDAIELFDWELAAYGPAGCDLQWHCLLHYWGYPPDGVTAGDDCDDLADLYVQKLGEQLGATVDRDAFDRGWKLGWLKAMAQLGYVLVDPLYPDAGDDAQRRRIAELCARAIRRAIDMRASLG